MAEAAIVCRSVSKRYALGEREAYGALRDVLAGAIPRLLGRRPGVRDDGGHVMALDDVSFEVNRGEVVGLVGANGAGKSTILKVIARITAPTSGEVDVYGRVGSLLEVGTGFHPELTGRENIYLNGAILGMSRQEIRSRFEEIVDFSEVPDFIDTPVKHFSIGMYMRLAFAVAAHLSSEILLIDEVLAVGDQRFQEKCLRKISDVARSGRTVVIISHHSQTTRQLCDRCILFESGRVVANGDPADVLGQYSAYQSTRSRTGDAIDLTSMPRVGTGEARLVAVTVRGEGGPEGSVRTGDKVCIDLDIHAGTARTVRSVGVYLYSPWGALVMVADSQRKTRELNLVAGINRVRIVTDPLPLAEGRYRVDLRVANPVTERAQSGALDYLERAFEIEVLGGVPNASDAILDIGFAMPPQPPPPPLPEAAVHKPIRTDTSDEVGNGDAVDTVDHGNDVQAARAPR